MFCSRASGDLMLLMFFQSNLVLLLIMGLSNLKNIYRGNLMKNWVFDEINSSLLLLSNFFLITGQ